MLQVHLFGTFAIEQDGNPVVLSSRAAQSLFAYLILTAGTQHRREKLAGIFWPDSSEEKARTYLRQQLWRIRKSLTTKTELNYLIADDITITFNTSIAYWLDVNELSKTIEGPAIKKLEEALSAYQGEFLPGFYEEWITEEREHLYSLFEQRMGKLLELLTIEKRWQEVLEWAERWITLGKGPESAYRYLMIAYDALGDRARVASTYERCVQALHAMDLDPSDETRALAFKRNSRMNIPIPLTSFIGREEELKEVADLLSKSRLVTLTGAGGAGKTRLAIQVVPEVLDLFPDGVWFLDLAPLDDPELVSNTLANLLGLRETGNSTSSFTDLLTNFFNFRTALIIIDNCEHLIESCALLASSLLVACQNLSILATSREALRISGEVTYRVPSLSIPDSDLQAGVDALAGYEAVRLFIERAAVASPGFKVDKDSIISVARICQRLDGIPLAIELAAARLTVLSAGQILKRLDDRFGLLRGSLRSSLPRQQTLRATIEWSYDLLSKKESLLFRRLAVFAGSWSLEAVETICSGDGIASEDILDLLDQLINKSLVITETSVVADMTGSSHRYRYLETIRQFANEKLAEAGEAGHLREKHLHYFVRKAEEVEPFLTGAKQTIFMDYLEMERDNLRRALDWSIAERQGNQALRLVGALGWLWIIHCHFQEGSQWFRRALELQDGVAKDTLAKAFGQAGSLAWIHEPSSESRALLRKSIELLRELDDRKELSNRLLSLGLVEISDRNFTAARSLFEETLTISRAIGYSSATVRALFNLADISGREGAAVTAERNLAESLAISRQLADDHLTSMVLLNTGNFAIDQQDYSKAREYFEEALNISLNLKNKRVTALALLGFADILCANSACSQSANLQGFAIRALRDLGVLTVESEMGNFSNTVDALKTKMGEESYQREYLLGSMLSAEKAVEIALR